MAAALSVYALNRSDSCLPMVTSSQCVSASSPGSIAMPSKLHSILKLSRPCLSWVVVRNISMKCFSIPVVQSIRSGASRRSVLRMMSTGPDEIVRVSTFSRL